MRRSLVVGVVAAAVLSTALVGSAAAAPGTVVFATWNVCGVNCGPGAPAWDVRRDRVARVIGESAADVIGLQEATDETVGRGRTQADDITKVVARIGYVAITVADADNECRRPRDPAQVASTGTCESDALLLYRTSTIEQFHPPVGSASGRIRSGSIAAGLDAANANRSADWAYLRGKGGAGPFLAIALHTDPAPSATAEASRNALAAGLAPWIQRLNDAHGMAGTPAVLMADLNSFEMGQPDGPQKILTAAGWIDAFTAKDKKRIQYPTINYNPRQQGSPGFPANAFAFQPSKSNPLGAATRIDYIMGLGAGVTPLVYEHVIYLKGKAFMRDYQASDHQMVKALVQFS